ncbi:MAG: tetratricopeptide repeat protein [Mariprofundus sp.]
MAQLLLAVGLLCAPELTHAQAQGVDDTEMALLQAAVGKSPDDYHAWFKMGVIQARKQQFKEAIISFKEVARLQPGLAEPHNNLAVLYNESGDFRAAVNELETSLKLNPTYTTAYENIGDLYVKMAANAYKKALEQGENKEFRQRYSRLLHVRDGGTDKVDAGVNPVHSSRTQSRSVTPVESNADSQNVLAVVESWRSAWSKRDLAAYFSTYADDFDVGKMASMDVWKRYKRRVIGNKKYINITLDALQARAMKNGTMRVSFLQHFRSDSFNHDDRKALIFKQTPDGWKIIREISK